MRELVLTVAPHKVLVDALHAAGEEATRPLEALAKVFGQAHIAEYASLGQVADERIRAIGNLESQLNPDTVEGVLQRILEKAPWLINAEWTVLASNESLETLRDAFEKWFKENHHEDLVTTTIKHKGKRPDFVLLSFVGYLEIVEIKRPKHRLTNEEFDRLQLYIDNLADFLNEYPAYKREFPNGVHATLVCDGLSLKRAYETAFDKLIADRVLSQLKWPEFLKNTKKVHEDFLKVARKAARTPE